MATNEQTDWARIFKNEANHMANALLREAIADSNNSRGAVNHIQKINQQAYGAIDDGSTRAMMKILDAACGLAINRIHDAQGDQPVPDGVIKK